MTPRDDAQREGNLCPFCFQPIPKGGKCHGYPIDRPAPAAPTVVPLPPPNDKAWPPATEDDYTIARPHAHYDQCVFIPGGEKTYTHPGHAPAPVAPTPKCSWCNGPTHWDDPTIGCTFVRNVAPTPKCGTCGKEISPFSSIRNCPEHLTPTPKETRAEEHRGTCKPLGVSTGWQPCVGPDPICKRITGDIVWEHRSAPPAAPEATEEVVMHRTAFDQSWHEPGPSDHPQCTEDEGGERATFRRLP